MNKFIFLTLLLTGCTDAYTAQWQSIASEHKIELYSGGELVKEFYQKKILMVIILKINLLEN